MQPNFELVEDLKGREGESSETTNLPLSPYSWEMMDSVLGEDNEQILNAEEASIFFLGPTYQEPCISSLLEESQPSHGLVVELWLPLGRQSGLEKIYLRAPTLVPQNPSSPSQLVPPDAAHRYSESLAR
jgi:hypothetical protein